MINKDQAISQKTISPLPIIRIGEAL